MAEPLQCEIVTPERRLYSSEATFVVVPGLEGEMGVYRQHSPQVATLGTGCVKVVFSDAESGKETTTRIAVMGGYVEITGEKVIVLAGRAMDMADYDARETADSIAEFEAQLGALGEDDPGKLYARRELKWLNLLQHLGEAAE